MTQLITRLRLGLGLSVVSCLAAVVNAETTLPENEPWGVEVENISSMVLPGDDFYAYVNEGWINKTVIPRDRASLSEPWVAQFKVYDDLAVMFDQILASSSTEPGTAERRIRDFHRSYANLESVERLGIAPVSDGLARIDAIRTHADVARFMADPMAPSLFHLIVKPPVDMQGGYVLSLEQYRVTGLGLPGQAYYKDDAEPFAGHRIAYRSFVADTLDLAGIAGGQNHAANVLELETRYARIMWDFTRLRDAGAAFDLVSLDELGHRAPGFPWRVFFKAKGVSQLGELNFGIGALTESAALFDQIPIDHWKSYLTFHWINNHAELLPEKFGNNRFAFFGQRLSGASERASRGDRAIEFVQSHLGWDVGSLYVDQYFPESSTEQVLEIAEYVRRAFREQLLETEWMDDTTRAEALKKADAIIFEMAEPKAQTDLAQLHSDADDLVGNLRRLRLTQWEADKVRIGTPISRWGDWNMYPHRVGLGFHQQYNKIFITAGALLPPFFDPEADAAVNFGSIGSTIGHEFGHSLDDQGSKFDSRGALRNWWTSNSRFAYDQRTRRLIEQFGKYEMLPGVALNSEQMIGEIVGDLTGALIGRRAFELYLHDHPDEREIVLDGFTGPQRYWLGLTQKVRMVARDPALRDMALFAAQPAPPHSINGVVSNLDAWYRDFDIGPQHRLYRSQAERTPLWE
ncbi:M13 family metallopeptidase [Pontixanthobacter sp. CEM42]|uniref:M13-type metalloendopeptidase n=1 Tax=Pontixanthobacter sp. CEM42 TaxID=2792077 RepID=UPI001AE07DBD|nr:M13 family metallopeptidase [Pontixanthobacter sp. CEM42]